MVYNTGPYTVLVHNTISLNRRAIQVVQWTGLGILNMLEKFAPFYTHMSRDTAMHAQWLQTHCQRYPMSELVSSQLKNV